MFSSINRYRFFVADMPGLSLSPSCKVILLSYWCGYQNRVQTDLSVCSIKLHCCNHDSKKHEKHSLMPHELSSHKNHIGLPFSSETMPSTDAPRSLLNYSELFLLGLLVLSVSSLLSQLNGKGKK